MTKPELITEVLKKAHEKLNSSDLNFFFHYLGGYLSTHLDKLDVDTLNDRIKRLESTQSPSPRRNSK